MEKLRNLRLRLCSRETQQGSNEEISALARETIERMKSALEDDLNTAQAQAAIFEMVRRANSAFDAGQLRTADARDLLAALDEFDEIFAVIKDDDPSKMQSMVEWAKVCGREKDISPALLEILHASELSDAQIEGKLAEMKTARRAGDYKRSDAIRAELTAAGIIVEQTKEGARWRRK